MLIMKTLLAALALTLALIGGTVAVATAVRPPAHAGCSGGSDCN